MLYFLSCLPGYVPMYTNIAIQDKCFGGNVELVVVVHPGGDVLRSFIPGCGC